MNMHVEEAEAVVAPRKRGRLGLIIAVCAGIAFVGLLGVRVKQATAKRGALAAERTAAESRMAEKKPLQTAKAAPIKWLPRVDVTGTLKPWREADVGFETGGRLVRVAVSMGDKVDGGQVLAVLDGARAVAQVGQAESQVAAARAGLALAQDTMKRTEALSQANSVPEAQLEQSRQQVALAKAQLEGALAQTRIARTGAGLHSVTAPFAGIVTKAPTGIGSVVNPGVPLVHIEDTSRFRLSATIGEEDVPLVALGAKVSVLYRDKVSKGKVVAVVPSLDQATRRAPVEIEVANGEGSGLLGWGFVRARIEGKAELDAVRLPALARRPGSQDELVKVERTAGGALARIVKTAFVVDAADGALVVQRGLSPGDEVLLSPSADLKDGDRIEAP